MKRLILVRHAKTEHTFGVTDFKRKLTARGHDDAKIIAEYLKSKKIFPEYFLSSDAKRAFQTAQIFAEVLGFPEENIDKQGFIYFGYTTTEFLYFISGIDNTYQSVIVFGHNPDIVMLASRISDQDFYHYPTTATVVIDFDTDDWKQLKPRKGKVELFVYPRMLKEKKLPDI